MNPYLRNLLIVAISCGASFAFGRWSVPLKIEDKKQISEASVTSRAEEKHQDVVTHEVIAKDGSKTIETHTVSDVGSLWNSQAARQIIETHETVKQGPIISLSVLASIDGGYGFHISRSLIGPVSVGAWGLLPGTGGVSLGLIF